MTREIEYRVKWAVVTVVSRYGNHQERMCIAESKVWFLWLIPTWWPLIDCEWRRSEAEALHDIEHDKAMRQPLPEARYV